MIVSIKITGMTHLEDVDSTWDTVKKEHSGQLIEIEKQNGNYCYFCSEKQKKM